MAATAHHGSPPINLVRLDRHPQEVVLGTDSELLSGGIVWEVNIHGAVCSGILKVFAAHGN